MNVMYLILSVEGELMFNVLKFITLYCILRPSNTCNVFLHLCHTTVNIALQYLLEKLCWGYYHLPCKLRQHVIQNRHEFYFVQHVVATCNMGGNTCPHSNVQQLRKWCLYYLAALVLLYHALWLVWITRASTVSQAIRCKTKTNRDLVACIFPCFVPATCICLEFSSVYCT